MVLLRPTRNSVDFKSQENGTNSYFYMQKGKLRLQLSWQTCRPHYDFVTKKFTVKNCDLLYFYPLENCFDWFYDYHTEKIVLRQTKYYTLPKSLQFINTENLLFKNFVPPVKNCNKWIYRMNMSILRTLANTIGFRFNVCPTYDDIRQDEKGVNTVLQMIRNKTTEALVGNYAHTKARNTDPFSLTTNKQSIILQLMGYAYNALMLMKKMYRARHRYLIKTRFPRSSVRMVVV